MVDHEKAAVFVNDERLLKLVRVKVLRPFLVGGKALAVGAEVSIEFHLAADLRVLGKVEVLDP